MNQGGTGNHWILLKLVGTKSNRQGIGARITVTCGELKQTREVEAGGSFASSSEPRAHFGVGQAKVIDQIAVRWPSGKVSTLKDIPADQILSIKE